VNSGEKARAATAADVPAMTETISEAFHDDPTWSWAFRDEARRQEHYRVWWGLLIREAMRFERPAVAVTEGVEAASVWIPPGESELSPEAESTVSELAGDLVGDHSYAMLELLERFEEARPSEPHYYLTLLGVRNEHRGRGIGMCLLAESLARFDADGIPAYLESSNAANDHRYEALGFQRTGQFTTPDDAVMIGTYWRDPA
jgi:ribosomal protein S18 acetylase RimI-like enzyme